MEFLPIQMEGGKIYAGFWRRFYSGFLDAIFLMPIVYVLHYVSSTAMAAAVVVAVLSSFLYCLYTVYFHYRYGATLGKIISDIKVTNPDGSPISIVV